MKGDQRREALLSDPELALVQIDEGALTTPSPSAQAPLPALAHLPLARRLSAFGFLLLAEFFYGWAWNTVDVLRPLFRQALGLSLTQAGSAYSAQGAGALIGAITIGQLADRLGRRNMLVVVMVGYGALLNAGVLVHSYPQLLVQRFALGLFLGGSFPVVVALYVDLFRANLRGKLASAINTTLQPRHRPARVVLRPPGTPRLAALALGRRCTAHPAGRSRLSRRAASRSSAEAQGRKDPDH